MLSNLRPSRSALSWRLTPLCFALVMGGALAGNRPRASAQDTTAKTVQLVVDFGDGVEVHFTRIPWKSGAKVIDAVAAADTAPHGVKFTRIGSGETAMVTKIGDVKNEGQGPNRRNWLYRINGKLAEEGIGAQPLAPGDVVLWKFEPYDYNSDSAK